MSFRAAAGTASSVALLPPLLSMAMRALAISGSLPPSRIAARTPDSVSFFS